METKKLLASQIEVIEKKLEQALKEKRELLNSIGDNSVGMLFSQQGTADVPAAGIRDDLRSVEQRIKNFQELLKTSEMVQTYNEDKVDIGTHFCATIDFDGEMETNEYVLVDNRDLTVKSINDVSKDSPLGSSVIGKEIGEPFGYKIGNMLVVGFIEDIVPEREVSAQKVKTTR